MVRYQHNNIIFRIASSDALSKFKAAQAQAFVQLARKELAFNESAKEAVLLEYDRLSQWLYRIERICMAAQEGRMTKVLSDAIKESFVVEINQIETTMLSYADIFTKLIVEFMSVIHSYSVEVIIPRIQECADSTTVDKAFVDIVGVVTDYLEHILMSYHDLNKNCLTANGAPTTFIADFCVKYSTCTGKYDDRFYPVSQRIKFFQDHGVGNQYVLTNYSSDDTVFDNACTYFANKGILLIPETIDEDETEVAETRRAYA